MVWSASAQLLPAARGTCDNRRCWRHGGTDRPGVTQRLLGASRCPAPPPMPHGCRPADTTTTAAAAALLRAAGALITGYVAPLMTALDAPLIPALGSSPVAPLTNTGDENISAPVLNESFFF
jgi:hypothetical protein